MISFMLYIMVWGLLIIAAGALCNFVIYLIAGPDGEEEDE